MKDTSTAKKIADRIAINYFAKFRIAIVFLHLSAGQQPQQFDSYASSYYVKLNLSLISL